jgi:anthranilate synthase component 1
MTESEFRQFAAQGYNRIPLVLETFADLDTPLSVYLKLANRPWSYLLESVQGGERFGRYSFIGLPAETRYEIRGNTCSEYRDDQLVQQAEHADPLDFVRACQARFQAAMPAGLPRFCGGLVGFFGYDTVRYIEPRLARSSKPDALGAPDILLLQNNAPSASTHVAQKGRRRCCCARMHYKACTISPTPKPLLANSSIFVNDRSTTACSATF